MLNNGVYHAEATIKKMIATPPPTPHDGLINMRPKDKGINGFNQVPHLMPGNVVLNTTVYTRARALME